MLLDLKKRVRGGVFVEKNTVQSEPTRNLKWSCGVE